MSKYNVAKCDPGHCLAPGLFRSWAKADYVQKMLNGAPEYETNQQGEFKLKNARKIRVMARPALAPFAYTFGKNKEMRIEFSVPEGLGVDDLRVLQGLIAMSGGDDPLRLRAEPTSDVGKQLRLAFDMRGETHQREGVMVRDTIYRLAKEIGYSDGGSTTKKIRDCIERMFKVSMVVKNLETGRSEGYHLLTYYESNEQESSLCVALNPRIADAVLGNSGKYTRIEMSEVRAFKTDGTHLIHQRLSGWIDQGKIAQISLKTLCEYVWNGEAKKASAQSNRKKTIKKCMNELISIGWTVKTYGEDKFLVGRPGTTAQEIMEKK